MLICFISIFFDFFCSSLFSGSADRSICLSDAETGELLESFHGHEAIVNSISPTKRAPAMLTSVSDDATAKVFHPFFSLSPKSSVCWVFYFIFWGSVVGYTEWAVHIYNENDVSSHSCLCNGRWSHTFVWRD